MALAVSLYLSGTAVFAATPGEILKREAHFDPQFSPDGKHLALIIENEVGHRQLAVTNLETSRTIVSLVTSEDSPPWERIKSIDSYRWVDNQHLILKTGWANGEEALSFVKVGKRVPRYMRSNGKYALVDPLHGSTKFIVSHEPDDEEEGTREVLLLDLKDRKFEGILYSCKSKAGFKAYTNWDGDLALLKKEDDSGALGWFVPDNGYERWRRLSLDPWATRIHRVDFDADRIWVSGEFGESVPAIYQYSISEDKRVGEFASHPDYSIDQVSTLLFSESLKSVVGMHLDLAKLKTEWVEANFANFQQQIDALFKDSNNRILTWSKDLTKLIVERHFPDQPAQTFLVDFSKPKLELLYVSGHVLKPGEAAVTHHIQIENREKASLDAFLTKPSESKKPPLVVLLREDPWGQLDSFKWHSDDQFFAAHGYAVLRLNFCGSGAYLGDRKQKWETKEDALTAIQDIETAVQWLGEKNLIDASRVAIVGTGASGWIASYASIASPNTFKAVACNTPIFDLMDYQDSESKDNFHYLVARIPFATGDHSFPEETLRELSPTQNASKLTSAFFVGYGQYSPGTYIAHVNRFIKAAKNAGVVVEKPYVGSWSGTGIGGVEKYQAYQKSVVDFLNKYL